MPKGDAENLRADLDDGYAKVANLILEALACAPLTRTEYAVVLCVMRQTYGWAKKRDRNTGKMAALTAKDIAEGTGKPTRTVETAIQSLTKAHVIASQQVKKGNYYAYGINPAVSEWGRVTPEWKEAKAALMEARQEGAYTRNHVGVYAKPRTPLPDATYTPTPNHVEVPTVSPTPTEPPGVPTDSSTDSSTDNVNDSPPAAPAAAPVPAPAEPPKPSELTGDVALQLVKQYPAETDAQIAIRECWQAFKLDGTPGGKLYSGLVKLVGEQGYPKVQAWAAYVRDDPPQLPAGAKPMAWFAQQFRRGMNRDFLWDDSGKQRALSKPYEEPSSSIGRGDMMTPEEIAAALVPQTEKQRAAGTAALREAGKRLHRRAVPDDTEPENDSEEEAMHRQGLEMEVEQNVE